MKLRIAGFKGEVPRLHPRLLPEDAAQVARNTRLENGALVAINDSANFSTLGAAALSIYQRPAGGAFFSWPVVVNVVPGPVNAARTYITGDGVPQVKANIALGQEYDLALHPPTPALTATPIGVADPTLIQATLFTYTYVTLLDEESQPAPLSNEVDIDPTQVVTLTGYPTNATIDALARGIIYLRIYRSQTDALGNTGLYFVRQLVVDTMPGSITVDPAVHPIQELCPSVDYDPPHDDLAGIISVPNGMLAAFVGQELFLTEPYRPHAWPIKYSLTFDFPIVGLASIGSAIAVLTTGTPYIVQGAAPDTMAMEKIEQNLPCVAAQGIVDLGYAVAYPSTEGLVLLGNGSTRVVTAQMFTRQQWAALDATTFIAGQHRGRYIFSHIPTDADPGDPRVVGIIDTTGETPYFVQSDETFLACFFAVGTGEFYILRNDTNIRRWDGLDQPRLEQTWRSKLFNLPTPVNFGAILIESDDYANADSCEVDVIADGVLRRTVTLKNQVDRLPSGFQAVRWEFEYRGTATISAISVAQSPSELAT